MDEPVGVTVAARYGHVEQAAFGRVVCALRPVVLDTVAAVGALEVTLCTLGAVADLSVGDLTASSGGDRSGVDEGGRWSSGVAFLGQIFTGTGCPDPHR